MPLYTSKGKIYDIPDNRVNAFLQARKDAKPFEKKKINLPPVPVPANEGLSFTPSQSSFSPSLKAEDTVATAMQNFDRLKAEQPNVPREKGFWNTWAGDAVEKLGEGTAWAGEGITRFANLPVKVYANTIANKEGMNPEEKYAFSKLMAASAANTLNVEMTADALKGVQEKLAGKADRYGGKDFADLWKAGDKSGAIGHIMLEGVKSLPMSIMAGVNPGVGLSVIGAASTGQKYEDLSDTEKPSAFASSKEWQDYRSNMSMGELAKVSNAFLSGAAEAGSELLGSIPIFGWLGRTYAKLGGKATGDIVKKGVKKWMDGMFDRYGLLLAPIAEGNEEVANKVAENTIDYLTGARTDFKPFEGTGESFVYGAGGGAQFSVAALPGVIANRFTGKRQTDMPTVPEISIQDQVNTRMQQVQQAIRESANPDMGAVVSAIVQGGEQPVRITGGRIVTRQDGSIDRENSDKQIFYIDEQGNKKVTSIDFVEEIAENMPLPDALNYAGQTIQDEFRAEQENAAVRPYEVNETVTADMGNGITFTGQITAVDDQGMYVVTDAQTGQQVTIEPRQIVDQDNIQGVENGSVVDYMDDQGNERTGTVDDAHGVRPQGLVIIDGEGIPIEKILGLTEQRKAEQATQTHGQPMSAPPIKAIRLGKDSFDFKQNDDGSFTFVPSEKLDADSALEKLEKEFKDNKKWEVVAGKEQIEVPPANPFQDPTLQTVVKSIQIRRKNNQNATQPTGGDNNLSKSEVDPGLKAEAEAETKPSYSFNGKDVSKDYVHGVIEDAQSKEDLAGLTYRNDPDIDAMIEKKFPAPKTTYRIGKTEVSRDRALARIDMAGTQEQLEELKIGNDPQMQQAYNAKLAEFRERDDQAQAEINRKHDKLVSMMQSYNQISPAERRRINTASMMQLASELGYYVKYENGNGVRIFRNGTEIRRNADRLSNDEIQSHRSLSDYDEPVQKLAGSLLLPLNVEGVEIGTMQPKEINQAILDVQAGKKTVLSNQLLDEIEKIHTSGIVRIKGDRKTGFPGMEVPIDEYVSMINSDMSEADNNAAVLIPEDVALNIEQDQLSPEILSQFENLIFEGYENTQRQTTGTEQPNAQSGTSESVPETSQPQESENVEGEVPEQVTDSISEDEKPVEPAGEIDSVEQGENTPEEEQRKGVSEGLEEKGTQTTANQVTSGFNGDFLALANRVIENDKIRQEEAKVNTNPSEAQKEAGNYKKGHVRTQGFDITIENPKGSVRSGVDEDGRAWEHTMQNSYGYFKRTEGKDGDQIDVFLGDNPTSKRILVVDQNNPYTGEFDESKVMLAFDTAQQAKDAYMSNYEPGWTGFRTITEVPVEKFREWLYDGARQRKPFSEYKGMSDLVKIQKENNNFEENQIDERAQTYKTKEGQEIQYTLQFGDYDRTGTGDLQRKDNQRQSPSLRKLRPGEISSVEMKYTADKNFVFDGRNKIESTDDVAYLFRQLENKSVENMFAALIDEKGKPTILHLSMGGRAGTVIDFGILSDAIHRFKPKKVYLLHNHPSGNLQYSEADIRMHQKARDAFGQDLIGEHIIINTTSGQYASFTTRYDYEISDRPIDVENARNYRVLKFDKQVFRENTVLPVQVTGSADVAKFVTAQRFSAKDKQSVLLLSRSNNIVAYLHISSTDFSSKESVENLIKELQAYAGRFGAKGIILTGKIPDTKSKYDAQELQNFRIGIRSLKTNLENLDVSLLDYVFVKSDLNHESMVDEGLMEPEGEYRPLGRITVDGIDRPAKNSEGKTIHPTESGIRNFWRWFSDFDKAKRIEKLRNSKPIEITGNEITPSDDLKEYKKNALEYGKKLQGEYINKDTGATVMLQRGRRNGGINEVLQHDYKDVEHLQSIAAIPQIIENGIYIDSRENDNKEKNPDVARYDYYVSGLKISNVDYTVRSSIAIDTKGNRYYDHKLTQIEKRKLLDSLSGITTPGFNQAVYNGFGTTPGTKPTTEYKDKKLLDLLQVRSSKVIDGQGRPLVVYHGSPVKGIQTFDLNKSGQNVQGERGAVFFTDNEKLADDFSYERLSTNVPFKDIKGKKGQVYPVYLRMMNPFDLRNMTPEMAEILSKEDGLLSWEQVIEWSKVKNRQLIKAGLPKPLSKLAAYGYDGVIAGLNEGGSEYAVFDPSQIKSVENEGAIDSEFFDILEEQKAGYSKSSGSTSNKNQPGTTEQARIELDKRLKNLRFRIREAWEDRHLAVKRFLDLLREKGTEIPEYNDYYLQATHINGKIDAQLNQYDRSFHVPLNDAIRDLEDNGASYRSIENYAILKHGLERNEWMRQKAIDDFMAANPDATYDQITKFEDRLPDDFSGITAVQEEVEMSAEEFISDFEAKTGSQKLLDNFWGKVKEATSFALKKQLEGGLIDKKTYDELIARYRYYIPLRGHDAETAEDRWDYSPDMGTYFSAPLLVARGRKTRSESPFAFISQMAQSAVTSSNRNLLNQTLLRLAGKDKTGLLKASKTWYVQAGVNNEGKPVFESRSPAYSDDAQTFRENIEEFEEQMKKLAEQGLAFQSGAKLNIGGLFIKPSQAEQHEVHVYQNGVEHVVYINANPAVSRAITGMNSKDLHKDLQWLAKRSKWMAANFTTRNPVFVLSNFSRDYIFASSILSVKENALYALQFQRNILKSAGALQRYLRGKADLSKAEDRFMVEYIMNGAKTGFSHLVELQTIQKKIERELKKGDKKNVFRYLIDTIGSFNEFAENLSRLSVYITSREQGRGIVRSVSDAKEVTVNFNRSGAGGYGSQWIRPLYLFVNAGIQALSNFTKVAGKNPGKTALLVSSYAMTGFLMPMVASLLGGDDGLDEYLKLSDWERQNNLCIYTGKGFIKIPLPHELRVFNKMGDEIYQSAFGQKDVAQSILDVSLGFADLIPANPMGSLEIESWSNLLPDVFRPFANLAENKNFMGGRIWNEWADPNKPGYLKVRTNKRGEPYAPSFLVRIAADLDRATGGDGVEKGLVSFNPDKLNHIMRGYFGGLYNVAQQGLDIASKTYDWTQTGEFELKARETPLRTFYTSSDDLQVSGNGLNSKYYKVSGQMQEVDRKIKGYRDQAASGELSLGGFSDKIKSMGSDVERLKRTDPIIKSIKRYESYLKELNGQDQKELEKVISNLKKEVISINNQTE